MEDQDTIFSDINDIETEASYFQRFLSNLVDTIISVGLIILVYKILPRELTFNLASSTFFGRYIYIVAIVLLYRLILLLVFDKTIGMMICKLKYLNRNYQPLSTKEKFIAVFITRNSNIKYYKTA